MNRAEAERAYDAALTAHRAVQADADRARYWGVTEAEDEVLKAALRSANAAVSTARSRLRAMQETSAGSQS